MLFRSCWMVGTGPIFPVKLPCLPFSVPRTPLLGPASSSAKKCLSFLPVLTCSFKVRVVCSSTDPQSRDRAPNPFWVPGRPQTGNRTIIHLAIALSAPSSFHSREPSATSSPSTDGGWSLSGPGRHCRPLPKLSRPVSLVLVALLLFLFSC